MRINPQANFAQMFWEIAEAQLLPRLESIKHRTSQLFEIAKLSLSQSADLPLWRPIENPLEIVSFSPDKSTAYINIQGLILSGSSSQRWRITEGYCCDPVLVLEALKLLEQNVFVERIVLKIDSSGGYISGCYEVGIFIQNSEKSYVAEIIDCCCSAAYWFAAPCDNIIAMSPTCQAGSIGTRTVIYDMSQYYEKLGIKVLSFSTGNEKDIGLEGKPVSEADKAYIQKQIEDCNKIFLDFLASARPAIALDKVKSGGTYFAEEAKSFGLIDSIAQFKKQPKPSNSVATGGTSVDYKAFLASLTDEQRAAIQQSEAEKISKLQAEVEKLASEKKANKYLAEATKIGNIPGFEQSQMIALLALADENNFGSQVREMFSKVQAAIKGSVSTNFQSKTPDKIETDIIEGDDAYKKLYAMAKEIQKSTGVSYAQAFNQAVAASK